MASEFLYRTTHSIQDHEEYWTAEKVVLKSTPAQVASKLAAIDSMRDEENKSDIYCATKCIPYVMSQLKVRNELGLYNDDTCVVLSSLLGSDVVSTETNNRNIAYFVDTPDCMDQHNQIALAKLAGIEGASLLLSNFLLIGYLHNATTAEKCIVVYFTRNNARSVIIKVLRYLFDSARAAHVSKVIMISSLPVSQVKQTIISSEYPDINSDMWSCDEMSFDWFGSRMNYPMAVCRAEYCNHNATRESQSNNDDLNLRVRHCVPCQKNMQLILGGLPREDFPPVLAKSILARRFNAHVGDLLDSARGESGRFIRHFVAETGDD